MGVASLDPSAFQRSTRAAIGSIRLRIANRASVRTLRALAVSRVDETFLTVEPCFEHGFLDEPVLRRFVSDEVYDLSDQFLDEALARGDRCYGLVSRGRLASFGWYAKAPTPIAAGLLLHVAPRDVYMYKGFTHPDFRGRRLHAIGMTNALSQVLAEGAAGIVSYVDSTNASSLASCYRMGYEDIGRIYVARILERSFAVADASCQAHGIRVTRGP